jgi:cysteinyl-tRNA synthetase
LIAPLTDEGIVMPLKVYNTLTRQKEPFPKTPPAKVGMYVCGPTVYKPSHIGHMVGPVIFDTVKRYLTYLGFDVTWVVNITDVDDKLIVRSRELGTTVKELAEKMTADYEECLKRLNVTGIDVMPRATCHIPEMIEIMKGLIDKGYAYAAGGDIYFDVTRDPDYGKLCNRDPEQMEAGARIEVSDKKRNPGDFAMWKGSKPGEPAWDSPWGPGRPGWHIECSAMSMKYLGQTLDIHGGGLDLQFPHHENELAQSESYTDQPFARFWMHNGLLKMGHAKMAGSVGNVINVADLLQNYDPETVRYLLLSTHYRSPIEYSEERLAQVRRGLETFYRFFERYERITGESFYKLQAPVELAKSRLQGPMEPVGDVYIAQLARNIGRKFLECMEDDFNTGGASAILFGLVSQLNHRAEVQKMEETRPAPAILADYVEGAVVLREMSQILGLFETPPSENALRRVKVMEDVLKMLPELKLDEDERFLPFLRMKLDSSHLDSLMQLLIKLRAEARKSKNFALADQIRKRLGELGVTLEDRPGGTGWRVG